MSQTCDVIATNIQTGLRRVMTTGRTPEDADAFIRIAIIRRGVDQEFYESVPSGSVENASFADEAEHEFGRRMERDFEMNGASE